MQPLLQTNNVFLDKHKWLNTGQRVTLQLFNDTLKMYDAQGQILQDIPLQNITDLEKYGTSVLQVTFDGSTINLCFAEPTSAAVAAVSRSNGVFNYDAEAEALWHETIERHRYGSSNQSPAQAPITADDMSEQPVTNQVVVNGVAQAPVIQTGTSGSRVLTRALLIRLATMITVSLIVLAYLLIKNR